MEFVVVDGLYFGCVGGFKIYQRRVALVVLLPVMVAFLSPFVRSQEIPLKCHPATDVYDGWRLGMQAWTFNRFTFYEAVDKTASLGLDWIGAYPCQRLFVKKIDFKPSRVAFDAAFEKE